MTDDNLPPLPEPALVIGTKLLPYEERHFSSQDTAVRLGYQHGIRSYYTSTQVEEIRRAAILAERDRFRAMFDEALADHSITWPGEVDILYEKMFPAAAIREGGK